MVSFYPTIITLPMYERWMVKFNIKLSQGSLSSFHNQSFLEDRLYHSIQMLVSQTQIHKKKQCSNVCHLLLMQMI